MLIISWNVAGLSTTVQRIHETYGTSSNNTKTKTNDALEHFFELHQVDILCLQEHKIPYSQLSNRSEPHQCASAASNYESFWSKTTPGGMNGVVTYVRKKSSRRSTTPSADDETTINSTRLLVHANANPLKDPDLDGQGRCLQTTHGDDFVLFNVYVPCNGGHALADKMKFLYALEEAMDACHPKPVILVGDLNITHRGIDRFWLDRAVVVDDVIKEAKQSGDDQDQWKRDLATAWPRILQALETKEVVAVQTTNPTTGVKFQKYRVLCTVTMMDKTKEDEQQQQQSRTKKVYLGKHEAKEEHCLWRYNYTESTYICPRTGETKLSSRANTVSLGVLAELLSKLVGIKWDDTTLRHISNELLLSENAGVCPLNPPRQWLNEYVSKKRGMVDVFRNFYPDAQGRYTCWNQNTNRRYANEGARIDYMWVDPQLVSRVQKGDGLRCGGGDEAVDPLSEQAALSAATANGRFQPASYGGEGIAASPKHVLDTQFVGQPHTGMIYTPPSFSDHIGVSLVLDGTDSSSILDVSNDKETKRAQPHKAQRSIAAFLTAKRPPGQQQSVNNQKRVKLNGSNKKKKPNTILHHFGTNKKG